MAENMYMLTCNTQLIVCLCENTIMFVLLNKKRSVEIIESRKWSALWKWLSRKPDGSPPMLVAPIVNLPLKETSPPYLCSHSLDDWHVLAQQQGLATLSLKNSIKQLDWDQIVKMIKTRNNIHSTLFLDEWHVLAQQQGLATLSLKMFYKNNWIKIKL